MTDHRIPEGYMPDAQGNLVPVGKIKPEHLMEDELVRELLSDATELNKQLAAFKVEALGDASSFREVVAEKYGATKGGAKGNMTLRSFDGSLEVQVAVSDQLSFGVELQAAKELIDNCLMRWAEGSNENLHAIVNDAFNVGKEGRIDTKRVLGLRRLQIEDPEWLKAMDAISDAVRTDSSKTYIRFYRVDPETGVRQPIPLDLAAV